MNHVKALVAIAVFALAAPLAFAASADGYFNPQTTEDEAVTIEYGESVDYYARHIASTENDERIAIDRLFREQGNNFEVLDNIKQEEFPNPDQNYYSYYETVEQSDYEDFGEYTLRLKTNATDNGQTREGYKDLSLTVEPLGTLTIDYISCNDQVIVDESQYCSVKVTDENGDGVSNAQFELFYQDNDNSLGTCNTNADGFCAVEPTITRSTGDYTVYGEATKEGWIADNDGQPTDTFPVLEQRYEIRNLETWEDDFNTASQEFFRGEQPRVSFDVYDPVSGSTLTPEDDIVTEVTLRVYEDQNAKSTNPGEPLRKETLDRASTTADVGAFQYTLDSIPLSDDYLGDGKVFAFAINYTDASGGQDSKDITILNNPLQFDALNDVTIEQGETYTLDLTDKISDVETQDSEIDVSFSNTGEYNVQTTGTLTYDISAPAQEAQQTISVEADDTDGSTKTQRFTATTPSEQAPTAAFTVDPDNPKVGETVTFDSSDSSDSDGTIERYEWSFSGPKSTTTGPTIQTAFSSPGTYEVNLTVEDNDGLTDTATKTVDVTADNQAPSASFTVDPETPTAGEVTTFDDTSTDSDGTIDDRTWNITGPQDYDLVVNDLSTFTTRLPSSGTYTAEITVTDDGGASNTSTQQITVARDNEPPAAGFTTDPADPVVNQITTFKSNATDDTGIDTYTWNITGPNGYTDDASSGLPDYTLTKGLPVAGTYNVTHTVEDDDGATDETTKQVDVTDANQAPSAEFVVKPQNPETGDDVSFSSIGSDSDGNITNYTWMLEEPDGNTFQVSGENRWGFTRQLDDAGIYNATLTVEDNDGATNQTTKQVTVTESNQAPTANYTFTPRDPAANETVVFNATTSSDRDGTIQRYEWAVNGQPLREQGEVIDQSFATQGDYNVTLLVTDDDSATDRQTKTVSVREANDAPTAGFNFTPENPTRGDNITFTSNASDADGTIDKYDWLITAPDGNIYDTLEGRTVTETFNQPGIYSVQHTVTDDDDATATVSKQLVVANGSRPVARLDAPSRATEGDDIVLNASESSDSDGTIDSYDWTVTVGDETVVDTTTTTPTYTFTADVEGDYRASVTVTDNDGFTNDDAESIRVDKPKSQSPEPDTEVSLGQYGVTSDAGFGVIQHGEPFTVRAGVSNGGKRSADDMRLKFTLPEYGYEREGHIFTTDSGDGETRSLHLVLPRYVPPGQHTGTVAVNGDNVHREKTVPVTVQR